MSDAFLAELRKMRIGYVPMVNDFSGPGDRRRFCYFARHYGIPFEIADPAKSYDVVVLSERADLSVWKRYPRQKGRIVYDSVDSYLDPAVRNWKSALRGAAKFAVRQTRYLELDFRKSVADICARSQAVVCSTEEQKRDILPYCANVHVILDIVTASIRQVKGDYSSRGTFNFVWEGLPENLAGFRDVSGALGEFAKERPAALHVITALQYHKYLGSVGRVRTESILSSFPIKVYLYEWNEETMSAIAAACDLALIPLRTGDAFAMGKPENKLLGFWRMGVPALTTHTPAYARANAAAGLDMTCASPEEWREKLALYSEQAKRAEAGAAGIKAATVVYGEPIMLARWLAALQSVFAA